MDLCTCCGSRKPVSFSVGIHKTLHGFCIQCVCILTQYICRHGPVCAGMPLSQRVLSLICVQSPVATHLPCITRRGSFAQIRLCRWNAQINKQYSSLKINPQQDQYPVKSVVPYRSWAQHWKHQSCTAFPIIQPHVILCGHQYFRPEHIHQYRRYMPQLLVFYRNKYYYTKY